jgi:hypothetical protein
LNFFELFLKPIAVMALIDEGPLFSSYPCCSGEYVVMRNNNFVSSAVAERIGANIALLGVVR